MRFHRAFLPALSLLAMTTMLLSGCGTPQAATPTPPAPASSPTLPTTPEETVVFAASSLTDAFGALTQGLAAKAVKPTYSFGGSQTLVTQLTQGARADVFASADWKNMSAAISGGSVVSGTQKVLATNKLAVIVSPNQAANIASLGDLQKTGLKIVLADSSVPAGNYADQVLVKLTADKAYGGSYKNRVMANVVSRENNVRQVVAKVQLGEADAGIVYVTDAKAPSIATPGGTKLALIAIPDQFNIVAQYYIAPLKDAPHPAAAKRFIDFALSDAGQKILESFGFGSACGCQ